MSTLITYFLLTAITMLLVYKLYSTNKKNPSDFRLYFLMGIFLIQVGQIIYVITAALYYLISNSPIILYWGDVFGKLFMNLSSAAFIQMPLYAFYPKSKKRLYVSYAYIMFALTFLVLNIATYYQPFIDKVGIIHWQTPELLSILFSIIMFIPLAAVILVSLWSYIQSKFTSIKSLFIFSGFAISTAAGLIQDYATTVLEFSLVNLAIFIGFATVFIALFIEEKGDNKK